MNTYFTVWLGATLLAMGLTALAIRLGCALRVLDAPGVRKVHTTSTPRLGGAAILSAALAMMIPVLLLNNAIGEAFRSVEQQVIALLVGGMLMFVVGLADDIRGLRARTKLLAQLVAAIGVCAFGIRVEEVTLPGGFTLEFGLLAVPITILWIIGITNAVNLIDGLDGLAAGIVAITCGVVATQAILMDQQVMAVLMLALMGSLSGFLVFNFNPAKIFMGDCGSLSLGFVIAASSTLCATKKATLVGLAIPALVLGVPIFDMLFSMLRRLLERRSMFAPDRGHIHHRLLDKGLHHRHAVIVLYMVTLTVAGLSMGMMAMSDLGAIAVSFVGLVFLILVFRFVGAVRLRESIAALQRNLAIARQASEEKRSFEESQLRFRRVDAFGDWWEAVCEAAERLDFVMVSIALENRDGLAHTLAWRCPRRELAMPNVVSLTIPVRHRRSGPPLRVEGLIRTNGSLEAAGRRGALFSRLIDEYSVAELPHRSRVQQSVPGARPANGWQRVCPAASAEAADAG